MLSGAERGSGGPRLRRHLLNTTDNDEVTVGAGRNLASEGLAAQLRELALNGGGCRTRRTLYHVHLDPDPAWSEADRRRGEALWWRRFEGEFDLADAAYSEVRHAKGGRAHTHRVYDLAGGRSRLTDMNFDRYRRQRLSAEVAHELGLPCPPIAHPRKVIRELEKRGCQDVADHVRATWRQKPGPEHTDLTPPASNAAATPRSARRDGIDPELAPPVVAPVSPRRRMQRDRTGVDPGVDVNAQVLAAIRSGDNGPARAAALRDAGLPVHMGDRALVVLDATGNTHPLLRAINAALKAAGEAPLRKADLTSLLAGAEIASLPAAGARPKTARRPAPAPQPVAAPPTAAAAADDLVFPTLADLDAIEATPVPTVAPAPAEVPARASAPPANADAYRGAETFEGAWRVAFGPTPTVARPAAPQRPTAIRAPDEGRRSRAPVAVPQPAQSERPAPAPFVAAIGARLDAPGWEAESWWTAVIEHLRAWLRGEVPEPASPPQPATPGPRAAHLDRAAPLVAFGRYRDDAQRRVAEKRFSRIFQHVGVAEAAEAGALLVALREGTIARHWSPATLARGGSPEAVAQQRCDLEDRAAQLAALEARINAAPPPTIPPIDTLWLSHCRRHHGKLFARTEGDLAKARRALDEARQKGDQREARRWDSALSILANERHRLLCRLRAERGGQDWQAVWRDAAQAGVLLRELRERQLRAVRDESGRIAAAIRASDPPTNSGAGTRPGYSKGGGSIRRPPRPAPPSDEANPPRPKG